MSEVDACLMVLSDTNATGYNHSGAAEVFSGFWPLPIHHMASVKKRKKQNKKHFILKTFQILQKKIKKIKIILVMMFFWQ